MMAGIVAQQAAIPIAAGAYNDWRVFTTQVQGHPAPNTTALYEIEMRSTIGGADNCFGGVASASSVGGAKFASKAFDASGDDAGDFWSSDPSAVPISPTWIKYEAPVAFNVDELVMRCYDQPELAPTIFDLQYWDGASWVTHIAVADSGVWQGAGHKFFRKSTGEIWTSARHTNLADSTSYLDGLATMGTHTTPTADIEVDSLVIASRVQAGASYQPVIYEVDAVTGAFIAEVVIGPIEAFASTVTHSSKIWPLGVQVTLVTGTCYALCLRRVDGTGESNADTNFYNGSNSFTTVPLTIGGIWGMNLKTTPSVGDLPTVRNVGTVVWNIGVVWKSGTF